MTQKKNPVRCDYHLGHVDLQPVNEETDLGVIIARSLMVSAKANKLLGRLLRTCPMLTDVKVRRSLYPALVKSQMRYELKCGLPATQL